MYWEMVLKVTQQNVQVVKLTVIFLYVKVHNTVYRMAQMFDSAKFWRME